MNRRDIIRILILAAVLVLAVRLADRIGYSGARQETELVREAVRRATLTCYAVEGSYPESLDYLRENYHLAYNEERYFVTYDSFAWNQFPDIYVTERGTVKP